ncbi:MAG: hypothetical protein AVDCRST_MAG13-2356, partial [uncultured Solirubrobacteraceae bacterium]
ERSRRAAPLRRPRPRGRRLPEHRPRGGLRPLVAGRQPLPRRHRVPLVLRRGPRPAGDRRRRGAADVRAGRLPHVRALHEPAAGGARRAARRARAGPGRPDPLHPGRVGGRRQRAQARPRGAPARGRGRAHGDPRAPLRLPRRHVRRDLGGRPARQPDELRPAPARRAHRRPRQPPGHARRRRLPRPGPRGGDHRRARHRGGRRLPADGGLPAGAARALRRGRRAAHLRRGHQRLRPAGLVVRRPALRRHAGPAHLRQGRHERLHAARRRLRRPRGARAPGGRSVLHPRARHDVRRAPELLRGRPGEPRDPAPRGPAGPCRAGGQAAARGARHARRPPGGARDPRGGPHAGHRPGGAARGAGLRRGAAQPRPRGPRDPLRQHGGLLPAARHHGRGDRRARRGGGRHPGRRGGGRRL